jgi:hypothetical protein
MISAQEVVGVQKVNDKTFELVVAKPPFPAHPRHVL